MVVLLELFLCYYFGSRFVMYDLNIYIYYKFFYGSFKNICIYNIFILIWVFCLCKFFNIS